MQFPSLGTRTKVAPGISILGSSCSALHQRGLDGASLLVVGHGAIAKGHWEGLCVVKWRHNSHFMYTGWVSADAEEELEALSAGWISADAEALSAGWISAGVDEELELELEEELEALSAEVP